MHILRFDCPDKKDEVGCDSSPNLEVRLVGGRQDNEGRIEVRAFDYPWGGICDDGFGIQESVPYLLDILKDTLTSDH